jgi:trigger factor
MNVEVTKLPESRVSLKIELAPEEVDGALDRTYKTLVQRVNVPGFRKGKAPRAMVERMVGREFFLAEATEEAVRWGYRKALSEEKLSPIDQPEIDLDEHEHEGDAHDHDHLHVEPGQPFHFEATVAVRPEVQLPDYRSLRIEREQQPVTDADVGELVDELRRRNATLEPTVRAAQIGDVVTMNVTARVDGEEVLNRENFDYELRDEEQDGPDPVFPGLSAELAGVNRGDIREIALTLPELYAEEQFSGKTMFLRILVKEIKRKVLPDADDDFAQSISEHPTLDELKAALRSNLEMEHKLEADEKLIQEAVEAVTSRTFVDIPPVLIEEELDRMEEEMKDTLERARLSYEGYLEATERSQEGLRNDWRETATRNVKATLVLAGVADAEGIEISNGDINRALEDLFRGAGIAEGERRRMRASATVRSNIRSRLRRQQAIQRLVEIMSGGEEVEPEAAEVAADQTAPVPADSEESVAVEVGG